jgi:hypothetical protein
MVAADFAARIPIEEADTSPPKPSYLGELGFTGVNPFGYYAQEESWDYYHVPIEELERMVQQDGQAQSLYRILTMPIRASEHQLTAADGGQAEYDFICRQLFDKPQNGGMSVPWPRVIASLSRAVLTGAEVMEKCFKVAKLDGEDVIMLDKIAPRPRRTLRFRVDQKGYFDGVIQMVPFKGQAWIPSENCLHFVVNGDHNPVFGQSMLLPAYYHYQKKHKLYYIGHLGFALAAVALKKLSIPAGSDPNDRRVFEQAAANMGVNTTISIPDGFGLEMDYGAQVPAAMIPFVNHHDDQMAKAVLAQILNLGTSGNTGSYALSETHLDLVFVVIESIMDDMSYLFNTEVIPELIDWNFGTSKYPTLQIAPSYTDRREAIKDIFRHVSGARQTNLTPEFMLELEKAMAQQLGFADEIDYAGQQDRMVREAKTRQNAQTGVNKRKPTTAPANGPQDPSAAGARGPVPSTTVPGRPGAASGGKPS